MTKKFEHRPFHTTKEEYARQEQAQDPRDKHYELAFTDTQFILREELRPVRLQLELLKTELVLQDHNIKETIVFFGSARIPEEAEASLRLQEAMHAHEKNPSDEMATRTVRSAEQVYANSQYLKMSTELAQIVSSYQHRDFYVVTGGGPSFMAAANRGAQLADKRSISLGVMLPHEQVPNEFVTPELTFQFHYFAIRKMHFLMRAKALVAFPGGFGTMDELFECLTLLQTQKIEKLPLILFRRAFWDSFIRFDALVEQGTISENDLNLIHYAETADEAWGIIREFYSLEA